MKVSKTKTFLSIFILNTCISLVCYAQQDKNKLTKSYKTKINKFYKKVEKNKTLKSDKITNKSFMGVHTISGRSDIKKYLHEIFNKSNYYYVPNYPNKKKELVLRQGEDIIAKSKKYKKEGLTFLKKKLNHVLKPDNTVYVMKLQTNGGKVFKDYIVFNSHNKVVYDNSFSPVLFMMKFKTTSTRSRTIFKN